MARGQRKTIEEKIAAKQELIEALETRVESEKRELEELYMEKKRKELEAVSDKLAEVKSQTVRLPPQERFDRFEPGQEVPSSGLYQVRRSASGYQVLFDPCAQ